MILLFSGFEENDGLVKEDVGRLSSLRDSLTMGMNGNKRFESGGEVWSLLYLLQFIMRQRLGRGFYGSKCPAVL